MKEDVIKAVNYNPDTGAFTSKYSNDTIGFIDHEGYTILTIDGSKYRGSRVAHLLMTGDWPTDLVDHKDRNRSNNKWSNLRPATYAENARNRRANTSNPTGHIGISKTTSGYRARLETDTVRFDKSFKTLDEAIVARNIVELQTYGVFAPCLN